VPSRHAFLCGFRVRRYDMMDQDHHDGFHHFIADTDDGKAPHVACPKNETRSCFLLRPAQHVCGCCRYGMFMVGKNIWKCCAQFLQQHNRSPTTSDSTEQHAAATVEEEFQGYCQVSFAGDRFCFPCNSKAPRYGVIPLR